LTWVLQYNVQQPMLVLNSFVISRMCYIYIVLSLILPGWFWCFCRHSARRR